MPLVLCLPGFVAAGDIPATKAFPEDGARLLVTRNDNVKVVASELSEGAADVFAEYSGDVRVVVEQLTVEVAQRLAKHKGDLFITVTRPVPKAVLESLAAHRGRLVVTTPFEESIVENREEDELPASTGDSSQSHATPAPESPARAVAVEGQPAIRIGPDRGDANPSPQGFSDEEWAGMVAELRRYSSTENAYDWLPSLRLAKKVFADKQIPDPSPRMIGNLMNKFAVFNLKPAEAEKLLIRLHLASRDSGVAIATREDLLSLEDGAPLGPVPQPRESPKYTIGGLMVGLQRIRFGATKAEVQRASPAPLENATSVNHDFVGPDLSALSSPAYPLAKQLQSPVEFVFRQDRLVGICIDNGRSNIEETANIIEGLQAIYKKHKGRGYAKGGYLVNAEKLIAGLPHNTMRMCFDEREATLLVTWDDKAMASNAEIIFREEDQEALPIEEKMKRAFEEME